mgnify:CR=1 FL=1
MPSPLEHLSIAMAVAAALPIGNRGAFFAGAIAPDIDKLLGWPRATTHWWVLGTDLSGALRLCAAKPRLVHLPPRSDAQVFVAGYLCHLVTDEQWTLRIYRTFFGKNTAFLGGKEGAEHQLALQGILDTEIVRSGAVTSALSDLTLQREIEALARIGLGMAVRDTQALARFVQSVVRRATETDPVTRLHMMAEARDAERSLDVKVSGHRSGGMPHPRTTDSRESLAAFVARLPMLNAAVSRLISPQTIEAFREVAIRASVQLLSEYLAGRALTPPTGTAVAPYFTSPPRTDL